MTKSLLLQVHPQLVDQTETGMATEMAMVTETAVHKKECSPGTLRGAFFFLSASSIKYKNYLNTF